MNYYKANILPFPLLEVNDSVWKDKHVAARHGGNTCDSIPLGMFCIRLVDSMKL